MPHRRLRRLEERFGPRVETEYSRELRRRIEASRRRVAAPLGQTLRTMAHECPDCPSVPVARVTLEEAILGRLARRLFVRLRKKHSKLAGMGPISQKGVCPPGGGRVGDYRVRFGVEGERVRILRLRNRRRVWLSDLPRLPASLVKSEHRSGRAKRPYNAKRLLMSFSCASSLSTFTSSDRHSRAKTEYSRQLLEEAETILRRTKRAAIGH